MMRMLALLALAAATFGLAWRIEKTARPDTGRVGRTIQGTAGHNH